MKKEQIQQLLIGVRAAGLQVMEIYQRDFSIDIKADGSPLTNADMTANKSLVRLVGEINPELPVLTEECSEVPFSERRVWERYWLIDPLDGTKEFINRSGEFTLNLALIENGVPVFGIVHAPALGISWWGSEEGAWKQSGDDEPEAIRVRELPDPESCAWQVVGSRLHGSETFEAFCERLPSNECVSMGSSLKLCLVAEGKADLYPRLAPTCEWDTAAAQAVVTAAGGEVLNARTLQPLRCNQQESFLNPFFIVCNKRDTQWESALARTLSEELQSPYEYRANDSRAEVIWNRSSVTTEHRSSIKGHKARCIWFTGLSGSGKSTLANALEVELNLCGYHTMLLDGDNVRHGLCKDLGMTESDRNENIRRVGEVAKLFVDAGLIVITAFISPYRADRNTARALFEDGQFFEVFVDAPLDICEKRDPKGLYQKAREGRIKDFTGIDSPYEVPLAAEAILHTDQCDKDVLVQQLIKLL